MMMTTILPRKYWLQATSLDKLILEGGAISSLTSSSLSRLLIWILVIKKLYHCPHSLYGMHIILPMRFSLFLVLMKLLPLAIAHFSRFVVSSTTRWLNRSIIRVPLEEVLVMNYIHKKTFEFKDLQRMKNKNQYEKKHIIIGP